MEKLKFLTAYPGPAVNIPDNDAINGGWAEINVSGVVPVSEVDYVTINLTHTWDSDLKIVLEFVTIHPHYD